MLPKDLYLKWDDSDDFDITEDDAGAESAVKPVDGVETKVGGESLKSGQPRKHEGQESRRGSQRRRANTA